MKKRAVLICMAFLALLGGILIPLVNAPSSSAAQSPLTWATVSPTGDGTELAVVTGDHFAVQPLEVTFIAGDQMRQANLTPESDGRFSLITFLPNSFSGSVDAVVQQGSRTLVTHSPR